MISLSVGSGLQANGSAAAEGRPRPWAMPRPVFGIVTWRTQDGGRSQPECYALVTNVYNSMIDVLVFPNTFMQGQPRQGVKHISDPSLAKMAQPNPGGVWDFCPGETLLHEALKGATDIIRQQAELMAAMRAERRPRPEEGDEDE